MASNYLIFLFMKYLSFLVLSLILLSGCGQQGKLSTAEINSESTDSPIINTTEPAQKEKETTLMEKKMEVKIETPQEEDTVWSIAKTGFTTAEVAEHSSADDCWLILDKKVYEVTEFIPSHPGGKAILKGCGKDATQMFAGHPESAKAMKEKYYIGELQ
jgi:cytochrome b involved in lipid metabolism